MRAKSLSVLYVHSGADGIRGSEQALLDLMGHLPKSVLPTIACDAPTLATRCRAAGIPTYAIPGPLGGGRDERPLRRNLQRALASLCEQVRPDIIHVNAVMALPWVLGAAWRRGVPVVVHMHLLTSWAERHLSGVHQATLVVGPSRAALIGLIEDGFPESAVRIVPNAVDPKRLEDCVVARAGRPAPTEHVIACVGALVPSKAVDQSIRILAGLVGRGVEARLRVAGDGPERPRLQRLADELAVGSRVDFTGHVPIGEVLRDADLLLTASRQEVFPLTLLEAAHAGLPIVASNIAAHAEAVVDGVTGRLFPVDDVEAGVSVVAAILADAGAISAMARAARSRAVTEFGVSRYVDSFVALYQELALRPRYRNSIPRAIRWPPSYWRWLGAAIGRRLGMSTGVGNV